jgi:hypothetical protein
MNAEQHFDSFVVKQIKESGANVRIFPLGKLRASFDSGHIRSGWRVKTEIPVDGLTVGVRCVARRLTTIRNQK